MCQTACTEVRDSRILSRHKKKLCWGHILINHLTVNSKKVCGVQAIKDDTWMPLVICQKVWGCYKKWELYRGSKASRIGSKHIKTRKHGSKVVGRYFE